MSAPKSVTDHSTGVKCHHFGNCNIYKVLYGERAPCISSHFNTRPCNNRNFQSLRDTLVYDSDNWSTYHFWFALSSGVFCFCVWPSFIGAVFTLKVQVITSVWKHTKHDTKALVMLGQTDELHGAILSLATSFTTRLRHAYDTKKRWQNLKTCFKTLPDNRGLKSVVSVS